MKWIVLKFGGSSLNNHGYKVILDRINKLSDYKILIVLSASKGITDSLIHLTEDNCNEKKNTIINYHKNLSKSLDIEYDINLKYVINSFKSSLYNKNKNYDDIVSFGEKFSTSILSDYLSHNSIEHILLDARRFILLKNDDYNSKINDEYIVEINKLNEIIDTKEVVITQGFVCRDHIDNTKIMTRGGSDTTASILAKELNAEKLEIWTDVNGIYTCDPNKVKNSKLIKNISYNLSQEVSGMGAKILHPYSIKPCQNKGIPIYIKNTFNPEQNGTIISDNCDLKSVITLQKNITIFKIKSLNMWNGYGFVYDIFEVFRRLHININIITTSQYEIQTTTDDTLISKLNNCMHELLLKGYETTFETNCSIVSVVNENITKNKDIMKKCNNVVSNCDYINIIHYNSNNCSINYVIPYNYEMDIINKLHDIFYNKEDTFNVRDSWWYKKINMMEKMYKGSCYIYDLETVNNKCLELKNNLINIDKFYYAVKANSNKEILKLIEIQGYGMECVTINEVKYIRENVSNIVPITFTPNYCNILDYKKAYEYNAEVIIDNIQVIEKYPEIFSGKEIGIRIDTECGAGHHEKVITEGKNVKFGLSLDDIEVISLLAKHNDIKIVGLHSHKGSGILKPELWGDTLQTLMKYSHLFPYLKWLDLGGGLGVVEKPGDIPLNLSDVNNKLYKTKYEIRIEPGRYLVSEAGILLTDVSQVRRKGDVNFIGVDAGMNSLIRPTLYNAYHRIHNISKIDNPKVKKYTIVGPICETGDVFGKDRLLPETMDGDLILIENAGAYGYVMSSFYNMKSPAYEICI